MRPIKLTLLGGILLAGLLVVNGCEKYGARKADETKPIEEVKAEAEKLDVKDLRSMALTYKDVIVGKNAELNLVTAELKKIPLIKMLGNEAKALKAESKALNKSISALKERFDIYYNLLKEKGGDLTDLEI